MTCNVPSPRQDLCERPNPGLVNVLRNRGSSGLLELYRGSTDCRPVPVTQVLSLAWPLVRTCTGPRRDPSTSHPSIAAPALRGRTSDERRRVQQNEGRHTRPRSISSRPVCRITLAFLRVTLSRRRPRPQPPRQQANHGFRDVPTLGRVCSREFHDRLPDCGPLPFSSLISSRRASSQNCVVIAIQCAVHRCGI